MLSSDRGLMGDLTAVTATGDGVITPAPAAAGCLVLGVAAAGRRRRG